MEMNWRQLRFASGPESEMPWTFRNLGTSCLLIPVNALKKEYMGGFRNNG